MERLRSGVSIFGAFRGWHQVNPNIDVRLGGSWEEEFEIFPVRARMPDQPVVGRCPELFESLDHGFGIHMSVGSTQFGIIIGQVSACESRLGRQYLSNTCPHPEPAHDPNQTL